MKVHVVEAKPVKAQRWTVMQDDRLVSFWAARINLPGHGVVSLTRLGELLRFETEDAANVYAKETASKWRGEATRKEAQP